MREGGRGGITIWTRSKQCRQITWVGCGGREKVERERERERERESINPVNFLQTFSCSDCLRLVTQETRVSQELESVDQ